MAESMVERPAVENKMGDSAPSAASLEVSVSFGKFDPDSLSWEKWSTFSPNKYLEEVEKCSTPGSVAQKKAYFEAHYKKIAARKTEQMEQERLMQSTALNSDESGSKDLAEKRSLARGEDGYLANGRCDEGVASPPDVAVKDKLEIAPIEEEKEYDAISVDSQALSVELAKPELSENSVHHEEVNVKETNNEESSSNQVEVESRSEEEATIVQDDNSVKKSSEAVEQQPLKIDNEVKKTPQNNKKIPKLHPGSMAKKTTPSTVEKVLTSNKRTAVSPVAKSTRVTKMSQLSTPRLSRSTMMPASRPSKKEVNGSPSLQRAKGSPGPNMREKPTSLHMSLSLDPASSGPSPYTTRKSLIMESMGDKDIVRRAFKTFQKSLNGLRYSNDGISGSLQQVPMKGPEKKVSTSLTPQKENKGPRKSAEKISQRGRSITTSSSFSSWASKSSGFEKRNSTAVSSSVGVRTDASMEKWKEKPGEKSFVREAEGSHHHAKTKDGQMKNVRQGSKPRVATTAPSFNRGLGTRRITPEKDIKSKVHRGPTSKG